MIYRLVLLAALIAVFPTAYASGVYTWIDEHGVRQFADSPPDTAPYRAIPQEQLEPIRYTPRLESPQQRPSGASAESRQLSSTTQRQNASAADRRKAEQRRRQAQQCERYQAHLNRIQAQLRSGYSNTQGNRLREERRQVSARYNRECLRN